MKIAMQAMNPIQMNTISATTTTVDKGLNSPQVGWQRLVIFSSKNNPSEQVSVLLRGFRVAEFPMIVVLESTHKTLE